MDITRVMTTVLTGGFSGPNVTLKRLRIGMGGLWVVVDLRRLGRKLGVKAFNGDPDGTLATLQVGRRLVQDEGWAPVEALKIAADKYAAPIDSARAFGAAHYALTMVARRYWPSMDAFENDCVDRQLPAFDDAIKNQGEYNLKAKRR
jgi:hypothetical protein